ncbi:MAG: hypothetical protein GXP01_04930 [Alphaproteobacteria bacterium]|nr:hypothetical protein [Alphaproteobacteria bacterium]
MNDALEMNMDGAEPPRGLSRPLQALWWLKKGGLIRGPEWEQAHRICQTQEGNTDHDWVHALAHWIEVDLGNADYWYRRCGKRRSTASVSQEWAFMVKALSEQK